MDWWTGSQDVVSATAVAVLVVFVVVSATCRPRTWELIFQTGFIQPPHLGRTTRRMSNPHDERRARSSHILHFFRILQAQLPPQVCAE